MKQLTIDEAIKEGYEYCGFDNQEDQYLLDIGDDIFSQYDEEELYHLRLFSKDPIFPQAKEDHLKELVADHLDSYFSDEFYNEGDFFINAINKVDFKDITNKINTELSKTKYYMITDIKLIKN